MALRVSGAVGSLGLSPHRRLVLRSRCTDLRCCEFAPPPPVDRPLSRPRGASCMRVLHDLHSRCRPQETEDGRILPDLFAIESRRRPS